MATEQFQFHKHEKGIGDEDWYYLVRDMESGEMHVLHEWSHNMGNFKFQSGEAEISLEEFLKGGGTRQDKLLALLKERGWG